MHFIAGILLIIIGWKIWKYSIPAKPDSSRSEYLRLMEDNNNKTKHQLDSLEQIIQAYRQKRQEWRDEAELNRRVAEDAVAREERAKAALIAVLKTSGCTSEQIDSVIAKVDGE